MVELMLIAIVTPIVIMVWVVAGVVCHLAWKDFFGD
jgi:hypothetical protein